MTYYQNSQSLKLPIQRILSSYFSATQICDSYSIHKNSLSFMPISLEILQTMEEETDAKSFASKLTFLLENTYKTVLFLQTAL
jgi:hypothetical protein